MNEGVQLEWSSGLHHALTQLLSVLRKSKPTPTPADTVWNQAPPMQSFTQKKVFNLFKFDVTNINVFVTNSVGASVMLRVDQVLMQHNIAQSVLTVDGSKVQYIICDKQYCHIKHSSFIPDPDVHIHQVKIKYSPSNNECRVHMLQNLNIRWTPELHLCLVSGVQEARDLHSKLAPPQTPVPSSPPLPSPPPPYRNSPLSINVLVLADISVDIQLSKGHTISAYTQNILVTLTSPDLLMEVKDFCIKCDGHSIFNVTGFQLETLPSSVLKADRAQAKILHDATNKAWYYFYFFVIL